MVLLHESMVIPETPLNEQEIKAYMKQGIAIVGNEDFDKYIEKNNIDLGKVPIVIQAI